jgi:hypothetical protein
MCVSFGNGNIRRPSARIEQAEQEKYVCALLAIVTVVKAAVYNKSIIVSHNKLHNAIIHFT